MPNSIMKAKDDVVISSIGRYQMSIFIDKVDLARSSEKGRKEIGSALEDGIVRVGSCNGRNWPLPVASKRARQLLGVLNWDEQGRIRRLWQQ